MRLLRQLPLLVALAQPLLAQPAPTSVALAPHATATPFAVRVVGSGTPVVLIPGLASGGAVWDDLVARLAATHECHVLTLAGFAGQPPVVADSTWLPRMRDAIVAYVREQRLVRPVLVGHSLGGFLALEIAAAEPTLPRAVVNVDGLPFLPATMGPGMTVEGARRMAAQMRESMRASPAAGAQMMDVQLRSMVRDTTRLSIVRDMMRRSDGATVAEAMSGLYTSDLRPALGRITVPVLNLHAWVAYRSFGQTRAGLEQLLAGQYAALRTGTTRISDSAYHFIMLDEPGWVASEVEAFLARAP